MLLSKRAGCDSKKSKFIKRQEASALLSSLGIKTPLRKISLVGRLLFYHSSNNQEEKINLNILINFFLSP